MQANRSSNTGPEIALRRALHRRGLRFRIHQAAIPGLRCRPDILFTRARVAVFVDGCFWHSCPVHATQPSANREWWRDKLAANVARDRRHDAALLEAGWLPLRIWEHETPADAAGRVEHAVRQRAR
jgi:DNA mismatch endonuclease (patch repair protein)